MIFLQTYKHEDKIDFPRYFVYLQTCKRVEVYGGDGDIPLYIAKHLFEVSSGLKSPIVGENQIQCQVRDAYLRAIEHNHVSSGLHTLFQNALRISKKIRTKTKISTGAMTYSSVAFEIIKQEWPNLDTAKILIIGVNNLNRDLLKILAKNKSNTIFVGNRTFFKAEALAREFACRALSLKNIDEVLPEVDIVISCTSAPHLILKKEKFLHNKKQLLIDLAVPCDIDPDL